MSMRSSCLPHPDALHTPSIPLLPRHAGSTTLANLIYMLETEPLSKGMPGKDVTNCYNSLPYYKTLGKHLLRQCRHECTQFMTCALGMNVLG
jgi:hypothetical protein